jgi:hypothetical protein
MAIDPIYTKSVTKDDLGEVHASGGIIRMIVPLMQGFGTGDGSAIQIPPQPPPYWTPRRDLMLRATVHHESMWAAAIGIAITKMACLSWEVTSEVPRRAARAQDILLEADGLRVGWVAFIMKHLRDYLTTDNGSFIEIVRETSRASSKIVGLRHLDSMRITRTGDPAIPAIYRDRVGNLHELKDYQIIMLSDMPDPADTYYGVGQCAASRAYYAIYKLAAIEWYLREKVTGMRPLAIHIVNGILDKQLKSAVDTAKEDQTSKGVAAYMGAVMIGIPADQSPGLVTIPLADFPDRFNRKEEFDIAMLTYADCIGLDPQDLQPLTGQAIGTGAQSQVLADKTKAKGLSAWRQDFSHALNTFVLDEKTIFAFTELDYRDMEAKAKVSQARAGVASSRITAQITTPAQELQILVDDDELPKEFLPQDVTPGDTLSDSEKPESETKPVYTQAQLQSQEQARQAAEITTPAQEQDDNKKEEEQNAAPVEEQDVEVEEDEDEDTDYDKKKKKELGSPPAIVCFDCFDMKPALQSLWPQNDIPDDPHVTLLMLGDIANLDRAAIEQQLADFANGHAPVDGMFGGMGTFQSGEDGSPVVLLLDSPYLPRFRQDLSDIVQTPFEQDHGFTPHLTLEYTNMPEIVHSTDVSLPVRFQSVSLWWGGEHIKYPLMGAFNNKSLDDDIAEILKGQIDSALAIVAQK